MPVPYKLIMEVVGVVCALLAAIVLIVLLVKKYPSYTDRINNIKMKMNEGAETDE